MCVCKGVDVSVYLYGYACAQVVHTGGRPEESIRVSSYSPYSLETASLTES